MLTMNAAGSTCIPLCIASSLNNFRKQYRNLLGFRNLHKITNNTINVLNCKKRKWKLKKMLSQINFP